MKSARYRQRFVAIDSFLLFIDKIRSQAIACELQCDAL